MPDELQSAPTGSVLQTVSGNSNYVVGSGNIYVTQNFASAPSAEPLIPHYKRPESYIPAESPLSLIGRDHEVAQGLQYLSESRLTTVHAPPGVGKTRVVLRIARRTMESPGHLPTYFFDLNYKFSADEVAEQMRKFFGFVPFDRTANAQEQLGDLLASLGETLLVIDNLEQVGNPREPGNAEKIARQTIGVWLARAEKLRILVGCRRELKLREWNERSLHLQALSAPTVEDVSQLSSEQIFAFDAVQLFLTRAANYGFEPRQWSLDELRNISQIVAMTGGFPAPIVVATSRLIDGTPLALIAKRMANTFVKPKLEGDDTAKEYLYNQLDQIYENLSLTEQRSLLQVSQFRGGFTFEAAVAIVRPDAVIPTADEDGIEIILKQLCWEELINRSGETSTESGPRYGFYLPIEEWAEAKWSRDDSVSVEDRSNLDQRSVDYYCEYFEALNALQSKTPDAATKPVHPDRANLLEGHARACAARDSSRSFRAMQALLPSLRNHGPVTLLFASLEKTLLCCTAEDLVSRAWLLREYSKCLFTMGRYSEIVQPAREALKLARESGNTKALMQSLLWEGYVVRLTGGARSYTAPWKEISEKLWAEGDLEGFSEANKETANFCDWEGRSDEGLCIIDSTLERLGENNPLDQAKLHNARGIIAWHDGRPQEAIRSLLKGRRIFLHFKNQMWQAGGMTNLGFVFTDLGYFKTASSLLWRARDLHLAIGNAAWNAVNDVAIARMYLHAAEHPAAVAWCERVAASVEANEYYENKAMLAAIYAVALFRNGDISKAEEKLESALEKFRPGSVKMRRYFDLLVTAADCAAAAGKFLLAQEHCEEAITVAGLRRIDESCRVSYYKRGFQHLATLRAELAAKLCQ